MRTRRPKAREWSATVAKSEQPAGPYTVRDALTDYLDWFRATGRESINETEANVNAFILPQLGNDVVLSLSPTRLRRWHAEVAATPHGCAPSQGWNRSCAALTAMPKRRAVAAPLRTVFLTVLKAALNHAWREGKAPSDDAWRRVTPFRDVDAGRVRYLDRDECRRLVNTSPEPLLDDRARRALTGGSL
jgi:hypothetical protein